MLLAACRCPAALEVEGRVLHAGVMCATRPGDVHHAILHCRLTSVDIELWFPRSGLMRATLVADVYYAVFGMLLAVHRPLATLDIVAWARRAGVT